MKTRSRWQYDEFKQVGKDYGRQAEVDVYDSSHARFRDSVAESNEALDSMGLARGEVLIDFGAGTGTFSIQAALRGIVVHAVDVSRTMIEAARRKAAAAGADGIEFHHAGFLTYEHHGDPVDAISTMLAFHHLPDFWKGVALKRMNGMLKPGGLLFFRDVIVEEQNALENIATLIGRQEELGGEFLREDAEIHFRDEYSTYDWVMEGMLVRSGFAIESKTFKGGVFGTYLCRKGAKLE